MGAARVADHVAAPLYEDRRTLLHGITFGGHPVSVVVALRYKRRRGMPYDRRTGVFAPETCAAPLTS